MNTINADELIKYLEDNLEIWKHPEALDWAIGKIKRWPPLMKTYSVDFTCTYNYTVKAKDRKEAEKIAHAMFLNENKPNHYDDVLITCIDAGVG